MKLFWRCFLAGLACLVLNAGCGGGTGKGLIKVTGSVSLDGKPLKQGTISFVNDGKGGNNAASEISSSGRYSLSTHQPGDGAAPGTYLVRIESWESPPTMDEKGTNPGKSAIPAKYNNVTTSKLTATINPTPSAQTSDFTLQSAP